MGGFSLWHWLIVGVIILLLFGKGRFSDMMGDVAKGLKSFKKGMSEEDDPSSPPRRIEGERPVELRPEVQAETTRAADPEQRREP
jgi:sec-independent protein translocase protein TatA